MNKTNSKVFVVVVMGYWGKSNTLKKAAENCMMEGARRREPAVAYQYTGDEDELKKITVSGGGDIHYPQTVTSTRLFGPSDDTAKTIGEIIREK